MHTVCVAVKAEKTVTYSVLVPYPEEKTAADGTKYTVNKCRPEERTRTVTITKCVPELRTHACPLTLQLDGLASAEPEVLATLAQDDGNLHLAATLATHEGPLSLKGVKQASEQALAALEGRSVTLPPELQPTPPEKD